MNRDKGPETTSQSTIFSAGPEAPALRSPCVVVIQGDGLGRRIDIGSRPLRIGRAQDADLLIEHKSVSRQHCVIWIEDGQCLLRDLGATNPTQLNAARIEGDVRLNDGDRITVGESILKFIARDSIEAGYHEGIHQLASIDALTGLGNRRHFCELADKAIARASSQGFPLALCIIDVDLFKPINDRFGHIAGDEVLRGIGAAVHKHARDVDLAGRIGGEEFALLLPDCSIEEAARSAERLRSAVEALAFDLGGETRQVTISIGIATLAPQRAARGPLMAAADLALYRAKREGRNRVCVEG